MKNKTSKQTHSRFENTVARKKEPTIPPPELVNMDELATMTDDVLIEKLREIEAGRDKAYEARVDTRPWEVEACYIRREFNMRRVRHTLHETYLQQLEREAEEAARLENTYPVADLDNSAFMFIN